MTTAETKAHLACSYALLVLHDEGLEVSAANIAKLIDAARVSGVEKFYPKLYASNVTASVIASTLATGGSGSSSASAAVSSAPAASSAPAKEEKKAPVKEEKKEEPEEDMDMGDLFG